MPDTSFYIEHTEKLEDVDFRGLLPIRDEPVRIILPMLVIDELDGQKRLGKHKGWRAAYTLAVLDRLRVADRPVCSSPKPCRTSRTAGVR